MDISLELYKTFVVVAKHCSFSKAANELFVSQSAISQAIKALEAKLGFPVFIRTTKKVTLTPNGKILYDNLIRAFNIISNAESQIRSMDDPYAGEIVIAATDTLCKYYLLPRMKKLLNKYANIKIKMINGTSLYCLELLEQGKVDFAVVNIPDYLDENFFTIEKSYPFQDVFVARQDSDIKNKVSIKELVNYPLLVLDHKSYTRLFLDALFEKYQLKINPEIELQNIDILLEMAKIGLGVSFVPDLCVKGNALKIIELEEELPHRSYGIISLKQLPLSSVAKTFVGFA